MSTIFISLPAILNCIFFPSDRCCCGRLMVEHSWKDSLPPISIYPGPGQDVEEEWSIELHTRASHTNAYGTIDFQDSATRSCRAKVFESINCAVCMWICHLIVKLINILNLDGYYPHFYKGLLQMEINACPGVKRGLDLANYKNKCFIM